MPGRPKAKITGKSSEIGDTRTELSKKILRNSTEN